MFPKLSDLFNYWLGTTLVLPVYTYGFMLVLSFCVVFFIAYNELKRKEGIGIIPANSSNLLLNIILITFLSSLAGLKFFHILDHWNMFTNNPVRTLYSFNGLSFYGGLGFGCAAVVLYTSHKKIPPSHTLDIAAPAILIGYAIGRLGCHLSGDGCWGIVNLNPQPGWLGFLPEWAWGFQYPHNVLNAGILIQGCEGTHCHILPRPVFPTPLYESFLALISYIILWSVRKKITTPGWLFSIFLIYYSTSRFFIEFIRVNPKYSFLGLDLSQSQYISVICFVLGIASMWYFRRKTIASI
jgi:phosphatidylglycerol:prolipoprotein diacylglycerol transferase